MKDSAVFLFTKAHKVVAQFPIPTTILQAPNQLDRYKQTITRRTSSIHHHDGAHQKIKNLKAGMKQINLQARVLEIPKSKTVHTRFGNTARVSNALIADETGSIRMSLWNQQINSVSKGDMITIKHGKVAKFRGQRQLRIGRYGSLSITE
jgi:replication factor A1